MRSSTLGTSLLLATALSFGSLSAIAQEASTETDASRKLDTITVTAQRKEESLQDVSAAVTAMNAETMEKRQILSTADISRIAPNVKFDAGTGSTSILKPYIRGGGITDGGYVMSESEVSLYLNDVYMARLQGALLEFAEIERIEVLRGPQGVLYGRNSSAGAVNIITKSPAEDTTGTIQVGYGSWNEKRLKGYFSAPLTEDGKWRGSIGGLIKSRDGGRQYNATLNKDVGAEDQLGILGDVIYEDDNFDMRLNVYHFKGDSDGQWPVNTMTDDNGNIVPISGDYYTVLTPLESDAELEQSGASFTLNYSFGDHNFKSITGYSELEDYWFQDFSGGVPAEYLGGAPGDYIALFERDSDSSQTQFSQELQLSGDVMDGKLEYVTGLYYFTEDADQEMNSVIFFAPSAGNYAIKTDNIAAYGQVTYSFTDKLDVIVGGRYTSEDKELDAVYGGVDVTNQDSYSKFTPKVGVDYKLNDDILLYASYSEGYKSGGYNGLASTPGQLAEPFSPQLTKAYEAGMKADFLDVLRLNVSAFFNEIEDRQQAVSLNDGGWLVENYDAEIKGIEFEATWLVNEYISLWGNGALNDGEYTGTDSEVASILDKALPSLPDYQYSVGFDVDLPVGPGTLSFGSDYNYRDDYYSTPDNFPIDFVKAQDLLNAYIAYEVDAWRFQIAGKNLLEEEGWQTGFGFSFVNPRYAIDPRSVLATVRYSF